MKQWVIIGVLLCLFTQTVNADSSQLELQFMGVDDFGGANTGINDIKRLWMGEDADQLYFVTQFQANRSTINLNFTILTASNDKYLISGYVLGTQYALYISHATSLTAEAQIPQGESILVQYIEKRIFYNPIRNEMGFYIDWTDIGGNSQIDVVGWTEGETERIPNTLFYTYNGTNAVDRTLDFDAALSGIYETWLEVDAISPSTTPPTSELKPTTSPEPDPVNPPGSSSTIAIIIVAIVFGFFTLKGRLDKRKHQPSKSLKQSDKLSNWKPESAGQQIQMTFVTELNREVRACCFQTARIGDQYCYCGRAVEPDVMALFDKK